ncbi:MAG: transporter substrate-binding domain-containing protein [Acidimicrobiales bacterium]
MRIAGGIKTWRPVIAAFGTVALVATTAVGSAHASPLQVPAKYSSGLTMAMDATYPPDEFMQNGKIVGFDADLAVALGKALGEVVDFVDYFKAGEGFYEKANSTKSFNGLKALCGHSVSVETGTTEQSDAESQAKLCHVTVLSYEDQNEANLAVSDGRADLGFADSQVAAYIVHLSNGQFKLTGTPFETAPYGFVVAKNSGLAQPLLGAVKAIMANGQYKKILDKWGVQQGAISNPQINGATS